ncbi:hypothetical protein LDENG_00005590 [Lucifuga dentata]|nr:hypothetical protein LDENG_00005590 [Lucifuga dentata]
MASAGSLLSKEQFLCPICLDVFTQPVSTPCGHNFCKECIQRYWQSTKWSQCPMCKQRFYRRPELKVNTFIAEVASQFKKSVEMKEEKKAASGTVEPSGEVSCDVCIGKRVKAVKSCLDCLASFCETHLEPHYVLSTFRKHCLMNPVVNMQDRVCKKHDKLLDVFCNTDKMCVCQICSKKDHKAHHTVPIEDESQKRRAQLGKLNAEVQKMIQDRLQKICKIKQTVQLSRRNTEKEIEDSLQVFTKLLHSIQRGQAEVVEMIGGRQKEVEIKADGLIVEMEREVDDLTRRSIELEQLSQTEDNFYLLHSFPNFSTLPAAKDWSESSIQCAVHVGTVRRAARRAACQLEETLKAEVKRLCEVEFQSVQQCAVDVTLDPDTAHPKLVLSDNKKQVHHGDVALDLPDNPERFYPGISVLGKEGFSSGRFYYEVQVKGKTEWDIGVGRESVNRKGGNVLNPEGGYWTMGLRNGKEYWALASTPIHVPLLTKPQKIGVYVDLEWGQKAVELPKRSLSPVLSAVVWTLLSCGILLALCFLLFTLRFRNNRIVKMSSPNLNVLTLFGSVLTYTSGFLFAIDERTHSQGGASTAVLEAQMWTLCIGSTLVFGPILGKTWRLYRVFTQRVPDKRVIIRDIQLMGFVALLILVDMLVLTAWNFTDPIRCSRSVGAVVKGCFLLYGTYLAGLTSNVSHPPVNQSPTIITAVSLVTLSSAVAVPVSIFLQAWPNLVYSTVAGAIFICTLATNCMLFVPQLTQWRQFEDEHNNTSQMAKYFSSPSKSQPSVYSQDEIYYLLGENNSMKKLLSEKNAVIDGLQEQVNNAKGKLLRLMSVSLTHEDQVMDSSITNLNSCSTQTTEFQFESPNSSLPHGDTESHHSRSHLPPHPADTSVSSAAIPKSPDPPPAATSTTPTAASPSLPDLSMGATQRRVSVADPIGSEAAKSRMEEDLKQPAGESTSVSPSIHVTAPHSLRGLNPPAETSGHCSDLKSQQESSIRLAGFVNSEQLQEIIQELSVDAVTETSLRSPSQNQTVKKASQTNSTEISPLSPLSLRTPHSLHPADLLQYPSISPYTMRKRRPPFHSSRRGFSPPCFYSGLATPGRGNRRNICVPRNSGKPTCKASLHAEGVTMDDAPLQRDGHDFEVEEEEEEVHEQEVIRKCRRCASRSHRCSVLPCEEHSHAESPYIEAGGEGGQLHRHIRHSCESWDSDSSSSTDYCYYHRPYCESCLQRGSFPSTDSSSDSSDSEYGDYTSLYRSPHPVVFKDDLKPTFV